MRSLLRHNLVRASAGFSLLEVLIAMAIFTVGFVSIASIFPAAAILQKNTVEEVYSQEVARNAKAQLQGLGIDNEELQLTVPKDGIVYPLPFSMLTLPKPGDVPSQWTLNDRSYPSNINPAVVRRYFWVPLVRFDQQINDWVVYVFVLRRGEQTSYVKTGLNSWANLVDPRSVPGVKRIGVNVKGASRFAFPNNGNPDRIRPGKQVLDAHGTIYTVVDSDASGIDVAGFIVLDPRTGKLPGALWYSPPGVSGRSGKLVKESPARRVFLLTDVVK